MSNPVWYTRRMKNMNNEKELIQDSDGTLVSGWFDDDEGNSIKDRD